MRSKTRPEGAQAAHGACVERREGRLPGVPYDHVVIVLRSSARRASRALPASTCAWVDDGVPCPNPLPYPGARGHGHLCDAHVEAEMRLAAAVRVDENTGDSSKERP